MLLLALARPAIPGHRTIVAAHSCTHNASITNITRHTFDLPLPSSTTTYTYHCSASLIILMQQYNTTALAVCFCLAPPAARYTELERQTEDYSLQQSIENDRCYWLLVLEESNLAMIYLFS